MQWFGLFVLFNVLLLTLLAMNVSRLRLQERVANGDGGLISLKKAIRAHLNGVEHVVVYALVILALSLLRASPTLQAVLVIGFSLARVLHAYGMLAVAFNARRIGAGATYLFELFGLATLAATLLTG
ncbi:glutathione S-transferase [Sinimarinibacterium sp. CAU 1509]|uniref:MAPEG family protein n=1 Tax=Sinimarinibacterium sp. CAU 1509 TaxID=2562283 RepID=UPI0010AB9982|nr:MAPEG family protein [Sinimarinibacterium sp. CAU 1509]TJY64950.1 glutathione S-transferase [Sinimarinibacterium sp. CAU 1509]